VDERLSVGQAPAGGADQKERRRWEEILGAFMNLIENERGRAVYILLGEALAVY
jgi:hypothetical protein